VNQADDVPTLLREPGVVLRAKSKRCKPTSHGSKTRRSRIVSSTGADLIAAFCDNCPATRVEPAASELQALAEACTHASCSGLVSAFREQLSWSSGRSEWQPRARALRALEYFNAQNGPTRIVAQKTVRESGDILRHLAAEVPQCRDRAARLLALPSDTVMSVSSL
jgi:hypothetical protein